MKKIDKQLDKTWSEAVKVKAGNKCEYCGSKKALNSHHIFTRSKRSTRWDLDNGICLCVSHHIGPGFSAHKTPTSFTLWLIKNRGERWHDLLLAKSNQTVKRHDFEKELILKELKSKL